MMNGYFQAGGDRGYTEPDDGMAYSGPHLAPPPQPFDPALSGRSFMVQGQANQTLDVPPPWAYDVSLLQPDVQRLKDQADAGQLYSYMQVLAPIIPVSSRGV